MGLEAGVQVYVYVGEEYREFELLYANLRNIFPSMDIHEVAATTDSSGWNPDIFQLFVDWLNTGSLPSLSDDDENFAKETLSDYLEIYFLATIWDVQDLENLIMDKIRARKTCEDGYFPCSLIAKIYNNTIKDAQLRSYAVGFFVFKMSNWDKAKHHEMIKTQLDCGNTDFVFEYIVKYDNLHLSDQVCDPNREWVCAYHNHRADTLCILPNNEFEDDD